MFEIWEESRLRECTFTTTWVLSLHDGKRRGARLASRANKDEIDQLKDRAEASQVTDVTELKKLLKQKVANGKSSGAKLSTVPLAETSKIFFKASFRLTVGRSGQRVSKPNALSIFRW